MLIKWHVLLCFAVGPNFFLMLIVPRFLTDFFLSLSGLALLYLGRVFVCTSLDQFHTFL